MSLGTESKVRSAAPSIGEPIDSVRGRVPTDRASPPLEPPWLATGASTVTSPPELDLQQELHALRATLATIVRHASAVVRVSIWEVEAAARARVRSWLIVVALSVLGFAAVFAVVVWLAIRIAAEVATALGGGALGAFGGGAAVLLPIVLVILALQIGGDRARMARRRETIDELGGSR